jgi:hypothetical protein
MSKNITREAQQKFITDRVTNWRADFTGTEAQFKAELPDMLAHCLATMTGSTVTAARAREIIAEDAPQFVAA